jgi:hypothetical protein
VIVHLSDDVCEVVEPAESLLVAFFLLLCQHLLVEFEAAFVFFFGFNFVEDVVEFVQKTVLDLSFHSSINYITELLTYTSSLS